MPKASCKKRRKRQKRALLVVKDAAVVGAKQKLLSTVSKQIQDIEQRRRERSSFLIAMASGRSFEDISDMCAKHMNSARAHDDAALEDCAQVLRSFYASLQADDPMKATVCDASEWCRIIQRTTLTPFQAQHFLQANHLDHEGVASPTGEVPRSKE